MFQSAPSRAEGTTPSRSLTTTYSDDYRPINERPSQLKPRASTQPGPASLGPQQASSETWPVCFQHFYKTTNSIYGSPVRSQSPFSSLLPALLPSFGITTPSFPMVDAGSQDTRVARKKTLTFDLEDEANRFKEQELKQEAQWRPDIQYEEGVIVLSPCVGLTCCDDYLKSLYRDVRPLQLPPTSSSFITMHYNKDAGSRVNSAPLWDLSPTVSSVLQLPSRRCSQCGREAEHPACCCSALKIDPPHICQSTGQPLTCLQPSGNTKLPLTEYQANFSAEWANPTTQQINHRTRPCHLQPLS